MARSGYIILTTQEEEAYFNVLRSADRFIVPRVTKNISIISRKRKKVLTQKSLLPTVAALWSAMSDTERSAWSAAGAYTGLSGWKLFVKDQSYRIKNDISGVAIPSNFHQALVGQLHIEAPSDEIKIVQPHPYSYYVMNKVVGSKSMYSPVLVEEKLVLPLQIGLSYKADLVSTGSGSFAKFYAVIRRLYQGNNINTLLEIDLDFQTDWKTATSTLSYLLGQYTSYQLYFHLYKVRGDLYIDNIKAIHSSQNWARDKDCNDINQVFTKAFYQIPKHWAALVLPVGSWYESVYPT